MSSNVSPSHNGPSDYEKDGKVFQTQQAVSVLSPTISKLIVSVSPELHSLMIFSDNNCSVSRQKKNFYNFKLISYL